MNKVKYPTFCKVEICWYDEDKRKSMKENKVVLLYATDFADASAQLEKYYGNELVKVTIEQFSEGLLEFPEDLEPQIYEVMENYL